MYWEPQTSWDGDWYLSDPLLRGGNITLDSQE